MFCRSFSKQNPQPHNKHWNINRANRDYPGTAEHDMQASSTHTQLTPVQVASAAAITADLPEDIKCEHSKNLSICFPESYWLFC